MDESPDQPLISSPARGSPHAPLPSGRCSLVYFLTGLSAIGGFLFGYDTGVVSGAMVLVRKAFNLTDEWHELIVSATIGSAWLFSLLAGPLADRFGRRPVVMAASVVFAAGAALAGLAASAQVLLIARLVLGVGIGLASSSVPVLIAECAPVEARGSLTSVNVAFITGGQLTAAVVCGALSDVTDGWRWMLGAAVVPALVQMFGLLCIPESPRYLVARGRGAEATASLTRLRPAGFPVSTELRQMAEQCRREQRRSTSCFPMVTMLQRRHVRRALAIGCSLQVFQQLAGINTVMYYSASIIQLAGVHDVQLAIWLSALTALFNFLGTLVGLALVERLGRRPLTLSSMLGTVAALLVLTGGFVLNAAESPPVTVPPVTPLCAAGDCAGCQAAGCGFCFSSDTVGSDGACLPVVSPTNSSAAGGACPASDNLTWATDWCPAPHAWLTVLGLCLYLASFAPGMGPMPWTINAEIYPAWARGTGSGVAASCNWAANLLVSLTFLTLVAQLGRPGAFGLYASLAALGALVFYCWLPETKGVPLEEMARLFGGEDEDDDEDSDILQDEMSPGVDNAEVS